MYSLREREREREIVNLQSTLIIATSLYALHATLLAPSAVPSHFPLHSTAPPFALVLPY